jgi:threonine/homoserine/homoserine lactone efflux protein
MADAFLPALALGFALGAAPGPIQLLILSETAKRGFAGGLRVMLGANLTLFALMLLLALGVSAAEPSTTLLRVLRVAGGIVLIAIAANEIRTLTRPRSEDDASVTRRFPGVGATSKGVAMVLLNPGVWVFFATTAATVIAEADADGGRSAAVLAAAGIALGVSLADISFTLLGAGGHRVFGERGLTRIRIALAVLLAVIGAFFVLQGLTAD